VAGIDVGAPGGRKRATNSDINMIPFIDLLMCTIAFLLITAVWVTSSRVEVDAQVPGPTPGETFETEARTLHVDVRENDFLLQWKRGRTLLSETTIPRQGVHVADGVIRYPDLTQAIMKGWAENGEHRDPSDRMRDPLVLHSNDQMPFRDLVAVLDAANATKRQLRYRDGHTAAVAAFNPSFAVR
jgi:Biopolymer transport protein ExbD/TolR